MPNHASAVHLIPCLKRAGRHGRAPAAAPLSLIGHFRRAGRVRGQRRGPRSQAFGGGVTTKGTGMEQQLRVMVIGASRDQTKFGNKAVRAYRNQGHAVFPVNPCASEVEGLRCYSSVSEVPGPIDRALLYLHAGDAAEVLDALAARDDVKELWLAPGADDPRIVRQATELGLQPVRACAILAVGESPARL